MVPNAIDEYSGEEKKGESSPSHDRPLRKESIEAPQSTPSLPNVIRQPPSASSSSRGDHMGRRVFLSLLSWSAHSILFLSFLALAVAYCLQSIHDDYFVPVVERARRTDEDLLDEFTYYQRQCNAMDITAGTEDAQDLFIRPNSTNYGVDQMMTHGSVLFPNLLSSETVKSLREFIVTKNSIVKGTPSEYPMSQGYRRLSYGIEATEDPAVIRALKEIHDNVQLQYLLEGLLGENPALTEITAITASYGCYAQAWHPDVKPDGSGVMFGRTYSHSYSLFMPLQDTTGAMGATDLCPGTHYCAGTDLAALCDEERIGMHQVSGKGYWPAGSAALLNQQVWHRGAAHLDEQAGDRVVFIVSFLARPNDTRQLARGTYFHMKWNMWGHTWADLDDSLQFMSWPWNIFACLHIWRPAANGWGYDLITAAAMRIANNQLGCLPADLEKFFFVLDSVGFPEWLDGTIDLDRDDAWLIYIRETIANIWQFLWTINIIASSVYLLCIVLLSVVQLVRGQSTLRVLWESAKMVLWTHGIVVATAFFVLAYVREQSYAKDITQGRMLMRPFAPVATTWAADPFVPPGPSTLPNRRDVLFGGRLDAKTIGAYNRWLEFHPGNELFHMVAEANGGAALYRSYFKSLPPIFARAYVHAVMEPILSIGGRILLQDYRTGDWLHPEQEFRDGLIQKTLFVGQEGPLFELHKEFQFVLGNARFGYMRETSMAGASLGFLHTLETKLFGRFVRRSAAGAQKPVSSSSRFKAFLMPELRPIKPIGETFHVLSRDWIARWTSSPLQEAIFTVGEEVCILYSEEDPDWSGFIATVAYVDDEQETVDLAVYGSDVKRLDGTIQTVPWSAVTKFPLLYQGSPVLADYENEGEYFPGTIRSIRPTGQADIDYDDGAFEARVSPERYIVMISLGND